MLLPPPVKLLPPPVKLLPPVSGQVAATAAANSNIISKPLAPVICPVHIIAIVPALNESVVKAVECAGRSYRHAAPCAAPSGPGPVHGHAPASQLLRAAAPWP